MSKQDRQGVRKAADIEQKYGLGQFMYKQNQSTQNMTKDISNLGDSLSDYKKESKKVFGDVHKDIADIQTDISDLQKNLDSFISSMNSSLEKYWQTVYPVGAIYMSVSATNPSTLFGGTWEQIQNRFLLAAGSSYSAGATGGAATHTLTTNQIPSHVHGLKDVSWGASGYTASVDNGSFVVYDPNNKYPLANHYFKSTGGGAAHNNMPPYLVVYVWKRTA